MGLKVLFIYPNLFMMNMVPPSVGIFSALLKKRGHTVRLFDTTYHETDNSFDSDKKKEEFLQVRPFNLKEAGIKKKETDVYDDLDHEILEFSPNIIALSVVEDTWPLGSGLINHIKEKKIFTIAGGVFSTFAPHLVIKHEGIDMVCIGEGEETIVELCDLFLKGQNITSILNTWVKQKDGSIKKNGLRKTIDVNRLPIPDYSIFPDKRLLRPMAGRIYRMLPVETHRGCPYTCSFCNSPAQVALYKNGSDCQYFRKRKAREVKSEIDYFIKKWKIEYVYFTADTFLALNNTEFEEFIEMYSDFKLPFWMQTRCETITPYKMKRLKEVGLHRISIGLEHGNQEFRKEVLKRKVTNTQIIDAFKAAEEYAIPVSVNNIIGFPDETRAIAQDTIEINTRITVDTTNCYAFTPFHGTPLRQLAVNRGYIKEDTETRCLTGDPVMNMPQFPKEEIVGLMRVFPLYSKLPKDRWPEIKKAEQRTEEGDMIFKSLAKEYKENFFF